MHRSDQPQPDVTSFAESLFALLPRTDQRRWAEVYLRGLLSVRGRKTLRRLAETVPGSHAASQCLQQFISVSPWDWTHVRRELTRTVSAAQPATAWTIGTAVIPKRGAHSVGVHRRFIPNAGRTVNCQVALGLFLSGEQDDFPVDWELLLNDAWRSDGDRLRRARIPEGSASRPEWAQVLDLVDRRPAGPAGCPAHEAPLIVDLQHMQGADRLLAGLAHRGTDVLARITPGQVLVPAAAPPYRARTAITAGALLQSGPGRHRLPTLASVTVRLPGGDLAYRLWAHRPSADPRAVRFHLTSLCGAGTDRVVSLLRHRARTDAVMTALGDGFGMLDFAGRSFPGWHHHMTMTSAAYAYSRLASAAGPAAGGHTPVGQIPGVQVSGGGPTAARAAAPHRPGGRATQPAGGGAVHAGRQRGSRPAHAVAAGAAG
ncbi:IS701 family transposase [Streptomyces sp. NPDC058613]|uniref:IS701 family transposase n=1 Tax=Streptomyces sp. NPDC058613 TaxID=3346556 RepID=UPI0036590B93